MNGSGCNFCRAGSPVLNMQSGMKCHILVYFHQNWIGTRVLEQCNMVMSLHLGSLRDSFRTKSGNELNMLSSLDTGYIQDAYFRFVCI